MASIVSSIVISKFLQCIILVIISTKSFSNKTSIHSEQESNVVWILDVVGCSFFYREGSVSPPMKNVMKALNAN
jgi:hypothetical protein